MPDNKRIYKRTMSGSTVTDEEIYFYSVTGQKLGHYGLAATGPAGQPLAVTVTLTQRFTKAWFGGKLVGKTADRLGSIGKYYPYGDDKAASNPPNDNEKFATYTRDAATGLDYADQRYHAPGTGRFMTADPYQASGGPGDPGSWNRYTYVQGNPTNFTDPSGRAICTDPFGNLDICHPGQTCGIDPFSPVPQPQCDPRDEEPPPPPPDPQYRSEHCAPLDSFLLLGTVDQAIIYRVLNENSYAFIGGRAPDSKGKLTGPQVTRGGVFQEDRYIINAIRNRASAGAPAYPGTLLDQAWQGGVFNQASEQLWFRIAVGDETACDDLGMALAALQSTPTVFDSRVYGWRAWYSPATSRGVTMQPIATFAGTSFYGFGS